MPCPVLLGRNRQKPLCVKCFCHDYYENSKRCPNILKFPENSCFYKCALPNSHEFHLKDAKEEGQMYNTTGRSSYSECIYPDVIKPLAFCVWARESTRDKLIKELGQGKFNNMETYREWLVQRAEGLPKYRNIVVVAQWFLDKKKKL